MKIRPVGSELFHADGQMDRHDEANSRFSQFCESAYKDFPINEGACLKILGFLTSLTQM
jgi:hypothetical protein